MSQSETNPLEEVEQLLKQGQRDKALLLVRQGLDQAIQGGVPALIAAAWMNLAQVHGALGDFPETAKSLEKALAALPGQDNDTADALARFRCLHGLGQVLIRLERKGKALEILDRALVAAGALPGDDSARQQAITTIPLAWLLLEKADTARAMPMLESAAITLRDSEDDRPNMAQILVLIGQARIREGEEHALLPQHVPAGFPLPMLAELLAAHVQQLAQAGTAGKQDPRIGRDLARWTATWLDRVNPTPTRLNADMHGMVGALEGLCKRYDHQVEALEKAVRLYQKLGETTLAVKATRAKGMSLAEKGEAALAEAAFRSALAQSRELEDPQLVCEMALNLAQSLFSRGNQTEAETLLREGITAADQVENADLGAMGAVSLGLLLAHSGRMAEAGPFFTRAAGHIDPSSKIHQVAQMHLECFQQGKPCPCSAPQGQGAPSQGAAPMTNQTNAAFTDMVKQILPKELASKLEAVMSRVPNQGGAGGMDPESARMLQELEARTMQRLQGMMGMLGQGKPD
ncbi:MAG: tetratricopeptide repeat protein [Planctomycetota bacterium]|nr:tetratricopeptide repeat protein [Planctomycetota bacterium]